MKKSLFKVILSVGLAVVMTVTAAIPALATSPALTDEEVCYNLVFEYTHFSEIELNYKPADLGGKDWWIVKAVNPARVYPAVLDYLTIGRYVYEMPHPFGEEDFSRMGTFAVNLSEQKVYPLETALKLGFIDADVLYSHKDERRTLFWIHRLGDADQNGAVNVADATKLQRVSAGIDTYDAENKLYDHLYDMNRDGSIDVTDATEVQKYSAGIRVEPAVERSDEEVKIAGNKAMNDFAVSLMQHTAESGKNVLVSPLSVMYALAMTANGAEGETLAQMEQVLGMSRDTMNRYFAVYPGFLRYAESEEKMSIANSIWFNTLLHNVALRDSFVSDTHNYYAAEANAVPFDDQTCDDINDWVNDKTGGMIPGVLNEINPDALMYLINALYFEADWAEQYMEYHVRSGEFTNFDGSSSEVEYLFGEENQYIKDEKAQGFVKPFRAEEHYRSGNYAFVALLPDEGVSVEDYIASLTGDKISALLQNVSYEDVNTRMPKFKADYDCDLSDILKQMGMPDAFSEYADFSGMVTDDSQASPYIGSVIHKTAIEVDESGTKASAVTVVEMEAGAVPIEDPPKEVYLTRPFVYMLVNLSTNTPFFIGTINQL